MCSTCGWKLLEGFKWGRGGDGVVTWSNFLFGEASLAAGNELILGPRMEIEQVAGCAGKCSRRSYWLRVGSQWGEWKEIGWRGIHFKVESLGLAQAWA